MNTIAPKPAAHDWRFREHYSISLGDIFVDVCWRCGMTRRRYSTGVTVVYIWESGATTLIRINSEPPCSADDAASTDKGLLSPQEG